MTGKTLIVFLAGLLMSGNIQAADTDQLIQESRDAAKMLGGELKSKLQAAMKDKGPVEAISVCNTQAIPASRKISEKTGLSVGRTSLKYRNTSNKPDAWEKSVLERFEQRKAGGEAVAGMEYSELTRRGGKNVFRYMKAMPADDVCLVCHGSEIATPVASRIKDLYPDDKAIGFAKGDIRGAFTVIKTME